MGADDVQFVRLEIAPAAERRRELIVEVGAARIRVGMEFDPAHLRAIVEALSHEASE